MMRSIRWRYLPVFLVLALFALLAPLASAGNADVTPLEPRTTLTYKTVGDVELKLHVFNPDRHKAADKRPAIVFFFGGGWMGGHPKQFFPHCEYLASRGMVAISAEYRTKKPHGTEPSVCVQDGKSAVRWIRSHADELGIDPDKLAAGGGSAGGHVAAATGTVDGFNEEGEDLSVSCRPDALVLFNPVYDNGPGGYGHDRVEDFWQDFSPMHNIDADTPPTVVMLGTEDNLIPVSTAEAYQKKMADAGVHSFLHLYEGQGHGFFNHGRDGNTMYDATVAHMDQFLVAQGYLKPQAAPERSEGADASSTKNDSSPHPQPLTPNPSPSRPNVLLIAVDDLRAQLGCLGDPTIKTPSIDRLAARGVLFERAYTNVPTCGPSRIALLTGVRTPAGVWATKGLKRDFTSLPAFLKQNGYRTLANGKVFHNIDDREEDWSRAPWRSKAIYHGEGDWAGYNLQQLWQNPASANHVNPRSGRGPVCESADVEDEAYEDGQLAAKTVADLHELADAGEPFFLAAGFWRPHLPFNAPKKYWDLYDPKDIDLAANDFLPENLPAQCGRPGEILRYGRTDVENQPLTHDHMTTEAFAREARHGYYASVSYVDAQIGKVLDALDETGLADNTIVVLWGDHGWTLGEHTYWGKHTTLEKSMRIPLIVTAPGSLPAQSSGKKTRALVESLDVYPTLCELLKLDAPATLEGTSFVQQLTDPKDAGKDAAFGRFSGCLTVKTDRYRYTQWTKNGEVTARMLFDHEKDPEENRNVAEEDEYREVVEQHAGLLRELDDDRE